MPRLPSHLVAGLLLATVASAAPRDPFHGFTQRLAAEAMAQADPAIPSAVRLLQRSGFLARVYQLAREGGATEPPPPAVDTQVIRDAVREWTRTQDLQFDATRRSVDPCTAIPYIDKARVIESRPAAEAGHVDAQVVLPYFIQCSRTGGARADYHYWIRVDATTGYLERHQRGGRQPSAKPPWSRTRP